MRLALLLLAAAAVAACDPGAPRTQTAQHRPAAERTDSQAPGGVLGRVLGVAVRAGIGGLMIVGIDLDGPLSAAGAQVGDYIVAVDGDAVESEAELATIVAASARSGSIGVDLWRDGARRHVAVAVAEPRRAELARGDDPGLRGLHVRELPASALSAIGVGYGVMVTRVRPPADRSRIMPGDVIVAVNQREIRSLAEFNQLMSSAEGSVGLLVRRADADLYIALEPGASSGSTRAPDEPARKRPTDRPLRT